MANFECQRLEMGLEFVHWSSAERNNFSEITPFCVVFLGVENYIYIYIYIYTYIYIYIYIYIGG